MTVDDIVSLSSEGSSEMVNDQTTPGSVKQFTLQELFQAI